jgi:hypothetical protein
VGDRVAECRQRGAASGQDHELVQVEPRIRVGLPERGREVDARDPRVGLVDVLVDASCLSHDRERHRGPLGRNRLLVLHVTHAEELHVRDTVADVPSRDRHDLWVHQDFVGSVEPRQATVQQPEAAHRGESGLVEQHAQGRPGA